MAAYYHFAVIAQKGTNLKAVKGLKKLLGEISNILLFITPGVLGIIIAIAAIQYAKAEDGMEKNAVKSKFTRIVIAAAFAGTAPAIANWIWGFFS